MSHRIDIHLTENPKADPTMAGVRNITDLVDGAFSWNIDAQGGFATAQLTIKTDEVTAFKFLNDYLGKRIVFTNPLAPWASMICWEGIVYTVGIDDGKTTVSRSLENLYNSVKVQYALRAGTTIVGTVTTTAATTNATSIAAYGTREVLWQVGAHASNDEAITLRNVILSEYGQPRANLTATRMGGAIRGGEIVLTLDCVGFVEQLGKRLPVHTYSGSYNTHISIIQTMLTAYGDMISTDYAAFTSTNTKTEFDGWEGKLPARTIIDALCAKGSNAQDYPTWFGVLEDRKAYYIETPTTPAYIIRKYDSGEKIIDATTGTVVPPWLVRPAKVVKVADLLPDELTYSTALGDPRQFMIGGVRFIAPNKVALTPATSFLGSSRMLAGLGSTVLGYRYW